jgi:hypothetical protein
MTSGASFSFPGISRFPVKKASGGKFLDISKLILGFPGTLENSGFYFPEVFPLPALRWSDPNICLRPQYPWRFPATCNHLQPSWKG